MKNLKEKTVLITGAGSGIGQALTWRLNEIGSKIIIIDTNETGLQNTRLNSIYKENCYEYIMDVSQQKNWQNLHEYLKEKNIIPDIIINNAGRAMSNVSIKDIYEEDFRKIFDTNFWGVFYGTREFLPDLLNKQNKTAIINFSSIYGITACGWASAYTTSKFAVRGFTETLRQELRKTNILVSCVHPGGVKTGVARNALLAKGSELTPEKIEAVANFEKSCKTTPEQAAKIVIDGILNNKKRILVGGDAKLMDKLARLQPVKYDDFIFKHILKN